MEPELQGWDRLPRQQSSQSIAVVDLDRVSWQSRACLDHMAYPEYTLVADCHMDYQLVAYWSLEEELQSRQVEYA